MHALDDHTPFTVRGRRDDKGAAGVLEPHFPCHAGEWPVAEVQQIEVVGDGGAALGVDVHVDRLGQLDHVTGQTGNARMSYRNNITLDNQTTADEQAA
jgi:hypothetical protein